MDNDHAQQSSRLVRKTFPVGPLACNCTILGDRLSGKALIVDPGGDAEKIIATLEELALDPIEVIHTHAHLDHFLASGQLKAKYGIPLSLHKADQFLWDAVEAQCRMLQLPPVEAPPPSRWITDDQSLDVCNGVCIHTPGHTPGSVSFWFEEFKLLLAGDTLFQNSIGRTDLPGGDFKQIQNSIIQRLYTLNEEALVIPGHGPETTIRHEMQHNLFVRAG